MYMCSFSCGTFQPWMALITLDEVLGSDPRQLTWITFPNPVSGFPNPVSEFPNPASGVSNPVSGFPESMRFRRLFRCILFHTVQPAKDLLFATSKAGRSPATCRRTCPAGRRVGTCRRSGGAGPRAWDSSSVHRLGSGTGHCSVCGEVSTVQPNTLKESVAM